MLVRGLTKADYDCTPSPRADHAAELLRKEQFDLVLLDINMPGKSGLELLQDIAAEHPDTAVIMLTGQGDVSTAVRAMRDGAYDYAMKPTSLAELVIRVEHALGKRALRLENRMYQNKLEQMVDELNGMLVQRKRELSALNKMFRSQVSQSESAQDTYRQLKESLETFSSDIEGMVTVVGIDSPSEPSPTTAKLPSA